MSDLFAGAFNYLSDTGHDVESFLSSTKDDIMNWLPSSESVSNALGSAGKSKDDLTLQKVATEGNYGKAGDANSNSSQSKAQYYKSAPYTPLDREWLARLQQFGADSNKVIQSGIGASNFGTQDVGLPSSSKGTTRQLKKVLLGI